MKKNHLFLAAAAVLTAGGLWVVWEGWRADPLPSRNASLPADFNTSQTSSIPGRMDVSTNSPAGPPSHRQMLRPPDPSRRFTDFTPEQRVQFARKGHGPGG